MSASLRDELSDLLDACHELDGQLTDDATTVKTDDADAFREAQNLALQALNLSGWARLREELYRLTMACAKFSGAFHGQASLDDEKAKVPTPALELWRGACQDAARALARQ